jgi:hypothetical protein
VKCGGDEVTDFVERRSSIRQGCSLSPYLCNIFIYNVIDYIIERNFHTSIIAKMSIPGLLFADDLGVRSLTLWFAGGY